MKIKSTGNQAQTPLIAGDLNSSEAAKDCLFVSETAKDFVEKAFIILR